MVSVYTISRAEYSLLCGEIRILPVAIQHVKVVHYMYRGGVILSSGTGTARKKNNMSNDQEVAQHNPNPALKAEIMK